MWINISLKKEKAFKKPKDMFLNKKGFVSKKRHLDKGNSSFHIKNRLKKREILHSFFFRVITHKIFAKKDF